MGFFDASRCNALHDTAARWLILRIGGRAPSIRNKKLLVVFEDGSMRLG